MKLGVILDGISHDPSIACKVLAEHDIRHCEIQYLLGKEIAEHTPSEITLIKKALHEHNIQVACITKHNFNGIPWDTELDSELIAYHRQGLERSFAVADQLDCPLVRIMSCRKEMILFGNNGAENWIVKRGAWDAQIKIMEIAVQMAEKVNIQLVMENENGGMITSNYLAAKLINEIGSDHLGILWDPCNALYCTEEPYPAGYQLGRKYIRHIHLKDAIIDIARATVQFQPLGEGNLAPYLPSIAAALQKDNYNGVISLEANYCPVGENTRLGFEQSVKYFIKTFK